MAEVLVTKEIDPINFQNILIEAIERDANILTPIAISINEISGCPLDHITLRDACTLPKTAGDCWGHMVGSAIGLMSLVKQEKIGVFCKEYWHGRLANQNEADADHVQYNDHVVGGLIDDQSNPKNKVFVDVHGAKYEYAGPLRPMTGIFLSRSFVGEIPLDISSLVNECEAHSETGELIGNAGYHLRHADNGVMRGFDLPISAEEARNIAIPPVCEIAPFETLRLEDKRLIATHSNGAEEDISNYIKHMNLDL